MQCVKSHTAKMNLKLQWTSKSPSDDGVVKVLYLKRRSNLAYKLPYKFTYNFTNTFTYIQIYLSLIKLLAFALNALAGALCNHHSSGGWARKQGEILLRVYHLATIVTSVTLTGGGGRLSETAPGKEFMCKSLAC